MAGFTSTGFTNTGFTTGAADVVSDIGTFIVRLAKKTHDSFLSKKTHDITI